MFRAVVPLMAANRLNSISGIVVAVASCGRALRYPATPVASRSNVWRLLMSAT